MLSLAIAVALTFGLVPVLVLAVGTLADKARR